MRSWTDEQLVDAVKNSLTKAETLRKLGLTVAGHYKMLDFHIKRLKIDISHFVKNKKLVNRMYKRRKIEELAKENGVYTDARILKKRIIEDGILPIKCATCDVGSMWNDKPLTLQLDHINGINNDNRLENLRFLCPNCHSQTDTFSTRKHKDKKQYNCINCGKSCHRASRRCKKCDVLRTRSTKIVWPEISYIISEIKSIGYVGLSKKLDVSDNAIRKHLKSKNVDLSSLEIMN